PVIDDFETRRLVGVVTDRDITVRAVAEGLAPADTQVSEIMSSSVVTVPMGSDLDEACQLMEQHQIRRIPVVDTEGRCCGIVSQADIALQAGEQEAGQVVKDVSRRQADSRATH